MVSPGEVWLFGGDIIASFYYQNIQFVKTVPSLGFNTMYDLSGIESILWWMSFGIWVLVFLKIKTN